MRRRAEKKYQKKNNTRKSYTRIVICLSTVRIIVVYFFFVYTFVLFVIVMYVVHVLFNLKIERSFFRRAKWFFFLCGIFIVSVHDFTYPQVPCACALKSIQFGTVVHVANAYHRQCVYSIIFKLRTNQMSW